MKPTVIKIGGGTLRNAKDYNQIVKILKKIKGRKILVVSAIPQVTNMLLDAFYGIKAKQFNQEKFLDLIKDKHWKYADYIENELAMLVCKDKLNQKIVALKATLSYLVAKPNLFSYDKDMLQSYGEKLSIILLKYFLLNKKINCECFESEEIGITCYGEYENANIDETTTTKHLKQVLKSNPRKTIILTGYYGVDEKDQIKTFDRGGTDYSASVIAKNLNANLIFLKNTPFMQIDPKIIPSKRIKQINFTDALTLATNGAIIMQPKAIKYLQTNNYPSKIIDITSSKTTNIGKYPPTNFAISTKKILLDLHQLCIVGQTKLILNKTNTFTSTNATHILISKNKINYLTKKVRKEVKH